MGQQSAMLPLLLFVQSVASAALADSSAPSMTMTERSIIIDGKPTLILSGAVHYTRVHEEEWDKVMKMAKAMGLNTIQTYTFWNFHEQKLSQYGKPDWTGRGNLTRFIEVAAQNDLYVTVRIGPYVCGEYYFGGIPTWLRTFGNLQCMRCEDPVWEAESIRWVKTVVDEIRPQLHSNGGNVIMLQIENEYSAGSGSRQKYLAWSVEQALKLTPESDVPWNMCHDLLHGCSEVNRDADGNYKYRVLCTINGFWMDEYSQDIPQPSPKWLWDLRQKNPGQPAIWTEDQGWFDQWGVAQRIRVGSDQLYGIARFFAFGGSWHNFYMLTGGNNYGLLSGGEVVTAYAPDTVIDSLLLRHEPRYSTYAKFFHVMAEVAPHILAAPLTNGTRFPAQPSPNAALPGTASLGHCTSDDPAHKGVLDPSQRWLLGGDEVKNVGTGLCLVVGSTTGVTISSCAGDAVKLSYDGTTGHIRSENTEPCKKTGATGQCHQCLDAGASGDALNWFDCKEPSDPEQSNQQWNYTSLRGIVHGASSAQLCLTGLPHGAHGAEYHEYGDVAFLSNLDETSPAKVTYGGRDYTLANHSVSIVNRTTGEVLFCTADTVEPTPPPNPTAPATSAAVSWSYAEEGVGSSAGSPVKSASPIEQLNLTENECDYLWYTATVPTAESYNVKHSSGGGTIFYVYVDGSLKVPTPLADGSAEFTHTPNPSGSSTLQILSVAMGLSNGGIGPNSRKGILGPVTVNGATVTGWTHTWPLQGEDKQWFSASGAGSINKPVTTTAPSRNDSLLWFKASFDLPAPAPGATQVSYALDLSGMNKGMAWVNGFHIGRYYLLNGKCTGACAPPIKAGHCYMHWKGCDKPTQHLYHVPEPILRSKDNLVVLFEETASVNGVQGGRDLQSVKLTALYEHPPLN